MDESLDSKRRHGAKAERPELRADRRPARGRPLLIRGAGGVKERWQLRSGPSCRCSVQLDELARVFPAGRHLGESSLYLPSVGQGRSPPRCLRAAGRLLPRLSRTQ